MVVGHRDSGAESSRKGLGLVCPTVGLPPDSGLHLSLSSEAFFLCSVSFSSGQPCQLVHDY